MCGAIDLRELAPLSVGKGAADRVVTLRREAAAFLPAASFELRAPDHSAQHCEPLRNNNSCELRVSTFN